ncbi:PREDICTED: 28S ribosomal protein S9, mitochondrial [Dinoponera quadriceps]|uniref:28S ribosomal protein S9, mitochondrial n=1 Tax=Dinoponera quadriceps TaxID=609295 RepID=A0A6P3X9H0_DINQU|nr:PREDICTED: 28S ribosomal protein S9, mitochondrial [Dinoponera quadriceps]
MAVSIFIRPFRRFIGINSNITVLFLDTTPHLNTKSRAHSTSLSENNDLFEPEEKKKTAKKISKAMMAYMQRSKEHDEFMKKEIIEYQIGKRHLANMMGEDPEFFTQEDVNRSIEYLFPSGLFDSKARPMMRHPDEIFSNRKAAEFDETGRPFHSMFYTYKPNYYETLYVSPDNYTKNIVGTIQSLNNIEDSLIKQGTVPMDKMDLISSVWLTKMDIEKLLSETLKAGEYYYLITSLERLCNHPLSKRAQDFIMKYRKKLVSHISEIVIPSLEHDNTGRPYITVKNCMRKSTRGEVTIWGNGSGKITINGQDITYFEDMHYREQLSAK